MVKNYVILRYNYLRDTWEVVYNDTNKTLAFVKYRQYRYTYPYTNYILREEVIIDEKH